MYHEVAVSSGHSRIDLPCNMTLHGSRPKNCTENYRRGMLDLWFWFCLPGRYAPGLGTHVIRWRDVSFLAVGAASCRDLAGRCTHNSRQDAYVYSHYAEPAGATAGLTPFFQGVAAV